MGSNIDFEMSLIIVEAIRGRCASCMSLPATISEIFGGQTTPSILVVGPINVWNSLKFNIRSSAMLQV